MICCDGQSFVSPFFTNEVLSFNLNLFSYLRLVDTDSVSNLVYSIYFDVLFAFPRIAVVILLFITMIFT